MAPSSCPDTASASASAPPASSEASAGMSTPTAAAAARSRAARSGSTPTCARYRAGTSREMSHEATASLAATIRRSMNR